MCSWVQLTQKGNNLGLSVMFVFYYKTVVFSGWILHWKKKGFINNNIDWSGSATPNGLAEPSSYTIIEIRDVPYNKSHEDNFRTKQTLELSLRRRTYDLVILGSTEEGPTHKRARIPSSSFKIRAHKLRASSFNSEMLFRYHLILDTSELLGGSHSSLGLPCTPDVPFLLMCRRSWAVVMFGRLVPMSGGALQTQI